MELDSKDLPRDFVCNVTETILQKFSHWVKAHKEELEKENKFPKLLLADIENLSKKLREL